MATQDIRKEWKDSRDSLSKDVSELKKDVAETKESIRDLKRDLKHEFRAFEIKMNEQLTGFRRDLDKSLNKLHTRYLFGVSLALCLIYEFLIRFRWWVQLRCSPGVYLIMPLSEKIRLHNEQDRRNEQKKGRQEKTVDV